MSDSELLRWRTAMMNRRSLLRFAGAGGLLVGLSPLLAACGDDDDDDDDDDSGAADDSPTEDTSDAEAPTATSAESDDEEEPAATEAEDDEDESGGEEVQGGTFSLPLIDNPRMWPVVGGLPNILVNKVLYSTLVKFDDPDLLPVGDLAVNWEISDDGLEWIFNLQENATWHDGEPLTADDVVFTVNEIWVNPDVSYYLRGNLGMIDSAEKVDDHTVQLNLNSASYNLPWMLGYLANILPEHIMGDWAPEDFTDPVDFLSSPIGSGPFMFEESVAGSHTRLVRNDDFYGGAPLLDAVLFRVVSDIEQQLAQLQTGELDLVLVEPHQLEAIEGNPDIRINEARQVNYTYIAFHNEMEPFTDVNVRQALTHAIDRESILENAQLGRGILANHPISPFLDWAFNDEIAGFEYDPDKARQMLDEAGWTEGDNGIREKDGEPLKIVLEVDRGNPVREQTAIFAQQYWQDIGADVEIQTSQFNDLLSRVRAGEDADVQCYIMWYITPPHPDVTAYYGCGQSTNTFHYCNEEVDEILAEARGVADQEEQAELYKEMQEIIAMDAPIVFLYYPYELQAIRTNIQNWPQLGYRDALSHITKVSEQ